MTNDDHEFYPGDHAFVDDDHLCHDCGRPRNEHSFAPAKDSTDEEIIDILLPVQELTRERDDLRAQVTTLEWSLSEANKAAHRFEEEARRATFEVEWLRAELLTCQETLTACLECT